MMPCFHPPLKYKSAVIVLTNDSCACCFKFLGDYVDLDVVSEDSEDSASGEENTDDEDEVESCLRGIV